MEDKLFLYNFSMPPEFRIPLHYARFGSIKLALRNFIIDSICISSLKFTRCSKFCVNSNRLIFNFLNNGYLNKDIIYTDLKLRIAKLINVYNNNELDFDDFFRDFVLEKIAKQNKDKKIYLQDNIIIIEVDGERVLAVMTKFYKFDVKKLPCIDSYVQQGFDSLDKIGAKQLYLVFPRNDNFRKHIEIIGKHSLKLIPYTLKYTLCKEKI